MNKSTVKKRKPAAADAQAATIDAGDLMAVVNHFQSPLLRYVGQLLGRIDSEAEDVVQEAFIRLHKQVQKHGADSVLHLNTWLFKVAHNVTIDLIRKRKRRRPREEEAAESVATLAAQAADEIDALGEVLRQEARHVALRELSQLDEPVRQVVLLKIIQGMPLREVGRVLDISVSTVNYRLNQGLKELARRLKQAGVV
jgi:RNA polymerase sigma-70 factor, ECF subfamily